MKRQPGASVDEPARSTPVYGSCDVLVIGGGPAGTAAAVAAGRLGADTVLVERYNHLGGLSTGGLVSWIDRMTDWDGNLVVAGVGAELIDRCGPDATLGPLPEIWGSKNPVEAAYWRVRTAALRDTVHWSPTVDPEVLKLVTNDIVRESNVHTLMHCWVVAAIARDDTVEGVIFESKQGRFALTAPVVIDCTGDGDVFAMAGARFDDDFDGESAHARLTTSFRFGNVDMRRYLDFRMLRQSEFTETMQRASREGISLLAHPTPYDSVALFLTPKMSGYSALNVADLTEVEFVSRDVARQGLDVLPRERARVRTRLDPRHGLTGGHTARQASRRCGADHDRSLAQRRRLFRQHRPVSRHDADLSDAPDSVPQHAPREHERSLGRRSQPLGRHQVTRRTSRDPGVLGDG